MDAAQQRVQGLLASRRQATSALGSHNPDMGGRGPTYERVQALLAERRARARQAQHEGDQGAPMDTEVSPRSDRSFEFDLPAASAHGGTLPAVARHAQPAGLSGPAFAAGRAPAAVPMGQQGQGAALLPPDENGDYAFTDLPSMAGGAGPRGAGRVQQNATAGAAPSPALGAGAATGAAPGKPEATLAELEHMLNQTMQQFSLDPTVMRVPSNKDMAYGMGGEREGPFDISDIWAMESEPSQSGASHSHSHSDHDTRRDDGQEADSYATEHLRWLQQQEAGQAQQQQPSTVAQRAGGRAAALDTPSSKVRASQHGLQQYQQQQQQPVQGRAASTHAGGPAGQAVRASAGGAGGGGSTPRGLAQRLSPGPQPRPSRPLSAQPMRRLAQGAAGGPRASMDVERRASGAGAGPLGAADGAARRSSSPAGRLRPRSAHPAPSPRYMQPLQAPAQGAVAHYPEFPFRPQINPRSREMAQRLLPVDRETRLEQLSRAQNERLMERQEQIRREREAAEMAGCTFRPRTGRGPSDARVRPDVPVHDRLYRTQPAWAKKREELLREKEEEALAGCTFQPQCGSRASSAPRQRPPSPARAAQPQPAGRQPYPHDHRRQDDHYYHHQQQQQQRHQHDPREHDEPQRHQQQHSGGGRPSTSAPYVPIHKRVADLLRTRNERLAKAQIRAELDGGSVTFQPEVNRRSVVLVEARQRQQPEVAGLPASERLYLMAKAKRTGGDDLRSSVGDVGGSRDQQHRSPGEEGPRVPAINPRSRALAESSDLPQDFLTRQAYLAALTQEKRALYRSLLEESTCTFHPQLMTSLNTSGHLGPGPGSGSGSGGEGSGRSGGEDRLARLAYGDVQKSQALRDALAQHHYGQFSFTPAINERSRRIGRRHSLTDLHKDEGRQMKLERVAQALEAQRAAECTFQPAINPRSASLGRQRRGSLVLASADVHEQANKLRSSILMEQRALKEYEELKECTFAPAINRVAPRSPGPVVVPGLGRHMELRELARRKREAEEARKAEVWHVRPKSPGPRTGVTVPQPFSFDARVLPWQVPRGPVAMLQQQVAQDNQQRALQALKQQRQQQRRDAELRRSARLHAIMAEAAADEQQQEAQQRALGGAQQQQQQQRTGGPQQQQQRTLPTSSHGGNSAAAVQQQRSHGGRVSPYSQVGASQGNAGARSGGGAAGAAARSGGGGAVGYGNGMWEYEAD